jgi:DNA-binding PadR family transcriptional regulator
MNIRTLILAILNAQDASGYEIKKLSSAGKFSYFVDISYGSIYPTLARLEHEGMVTSRSEAQTGKPDRRVYTITGKGRAELIQSLALPPQRDKFKSEFLLVTMHAELAGEHAIERAIDDRIHWLESELEMLEQASANCGHPATLWTISYGRSVMRNDLAYLREHRTELIRLAADRAQEAAE